MIDYLTLVFGVVGFFIAAWFWQLKTRDASIVDVFWALGIGTVAILQFWILDPQNYLKWAVLLVILPWSFRLSFYLARRVLSKKEEDVRYKNLRDEWGDRAPFKFLMIYLMNAGLILLLNVPIYLALTAPISSLVVASMGLFLGLLSIAGEALADKQLSDFKADPKNKGKTCQTGLWRYSRHPNYFFEWLHWWAYVIFAWGHPYWFLSTLGPIVMGIFLWKITGVQMTEQNSLKTRPDYADYKRRTSPFFPWLPKG